MDPAVDDPDGAVEFELESAPEIDGTVIAVHATLGNYVIRPPDGATAGGSIQGKGLSLGMAYMSSFAPQSIVWQAGNRRAIAPPNDATVLPITYIAMPALAIRTARRVRLAGIKRARNTPAASS